mmetsp:Transcript_31692/g.82989  ORF Transcript_31692/g.82989 Transcript_31692/m.82989 type:complete len:499 (+) Transcript_31692:368-1864(+)|eukprot:CAMPEP_0206308274 /NCGR_PEP_ID=MMETSP0106_2-20121207/11774_1 /ASSEMBLY_ACC=CAM_ASM_000206 /TAXON_ID=81532 /ORGANISM="Acanthoeca-like sp., Strain 10tr" /LENGTH=498 /DNA_ID=CAMNT_0053739307 /DNA_START=286 /DNA_END=1782 /DNA_ORIENTATION=+
MPRCSPARLADYLASMSELSATVAAECGRVKAVTEDFDTLPADDRDATIDQAFSVPCAVDESEYGPDLWGKTVFDLLEHGRRTRAAMVQATSALKGGGGAGIHGSPPSVAAGGGAREIEVVMGSAGRARVGTMGDVGHAKPSKSARRLKYPKGQPSPKNSPKSPRSPPSRRRVHAGDISAPQLLVDDATADRESPTAGSEKVGAEHAEFEMRPRAATSDGLSPRRGKQSHRMAAGNRGGGIFEPRVEVSELVHDMGGGQLQSMLDSTPMSSPQRLAASGDRILAESSPTSPRKGSPRTVRHKPDGKSPADDKPRRSTFSKLLKKTKRRNGRKSDDTSVATVDGGHESATAETSTDPAEASGAESAAADANIDWSQMVQDEMAQISTPTSPRDGEPANTVAAPSSSAWASYLDIHPLPPSTDGDVAGPTGLGEAVVTAGVVTESTQPEERVVVEHTGPPTVDNVTAPTTVVPVAVEVAVATAAAAETAPQSAWNILDSL